MRVRSGIDLTVPDRRDQTRALDAHKLVCAVIACAVLAYGALLAWGSPTGFPASSVYRGHMPYLADKPVGEDGFYMLTVAHNIATKGRILYNGDLQTTGIQPLATFVFAAMDWVVIRAGGGPDALVQAVLFFGVVLLLLFAWTMARIAESLAPEPRRALVFSLAFLLTLLNYTLFRLFTYGLETGVYLLCLALCFAVMVRIAKRGWATAADAVLLGLAGGLSGEARIDFGVLFAFLLVMLIWRRWMSVGLAALSGFIAGVVVSPWFLYLHRVTGSWMPSSGKAESRLISGADTWIRLKTIALSVLAEVAPWSYGGMSKLTVVVTLVSAAAVVWLWRSEAGERVRAESPLAVQVARMWVPGLVALIVLYVLLFYSTHFYHRYMAPWAVVLTPLLALMLAGMPLLRRNLGLFTVGLCVLFTAWTVGALHTGRIGNTQTVATGYLLAHYPGVHAGAFQSGAMGYYDPDVENLDGKLNIDAWNAQHEKRLPEFIDRQGIQVLVDWPSVIEFFLPKDYLTREWEPCPVPLVGTESECLVRKGGVGLVR